MLLIKKINEFGDLRGAIYDFEKSGDILGKHSHTEDDVHITIVCRGSVKVQSHDWEKIVRMGGIINFRAGEPHEFVALEDNTRIINIQKNYLNVVRNTDLEG